MNSRNPCQSQTLARNSLAHVQRCSECGCVSVHVGPVTLRVDDSGLEALWAVLSEAASQLHARKKGEMPEMSVPLRAVEH